MTIYLLTIYRVKKLLLNLTTGVKCVLYCSSAVNSIALVKPERAQQVEGMLIQMAQTGQIRGQIGEVELVDLLEKISQKTQKKTTITFERRKTDLDDSDDDF